MWALLREVFPDRLWTRNAPSTYMRWSRERGVLMPPSVAVLRIVLLLYVTASGPYYIYIYFGILIYHHM